MSNFGLLPEDIWRLILVASPPATIRRCQQVCRSLKQIINTDTYIQYLLDLDACGYVEPLSPRLDLTYSEKREVIQEHRLHWENPQTISPVEHKLPINDDSIWWKYADGVYAWDMKAMDPGSHMTMARQLHFCQLPSSNRGIKYNHWVIHHLDVEAVDFAIDPGQDLLLVFEVPSVHERACKMHLRTMSTNKPHPRASLDFPVLVHKPLPMLFPGITFASEICGHLLAVAFPSSNNRPPAHVAIWNWTTGVEILRLNAGHDCSFTLLAENLILLPRSTKANNTQNINFDATYSSLDVYRFDPQAITSTKPVHIASFMLPGVNHRGHHTCAWFRCAPTTGIFGTRARLDSFSKVFNVALDDRLLYLDITQDTKYVRSLVFSSSVLLSILANNRPQHTNPVDVPWVDWAEKTSWVDVKNWGFTLGHPSFGHPSFGQRKVVFETTTSRGLDRLAILDFNQHRVTRALSDEQTSWEVCTPINDALTGGVFKQVDEAMLCGREDLARSKFMKFTFPARYDINRRQNIMIDDEHMVVEKVNSNAITLLVYSF